jgi:transcriptional regulator with XRE-family HTH domain
MVEEAMAIKDRLRQLRKARGLTQQALAFKSGLSMASVIHLEAGRTPDPRASTLKALANALGVGVDDLLGDEPGPPTADPGEAPKKPRKGRGK